MELKDNGNNQDNSQYNGDNSYYQQNTPYGQTPYGQTSYSQNSYNQNSYNQNPYGQNPYGQNQYQQPDPSQAYYAQRTVLNGQYIQGNGQSTSGSGVGALAAGVLESVLAKSFLYMFIALLVSGITALTVAKSTSLLYMMYGHGVAPIIVCAVLELVLVIACTATVKKNNVALSAVLFLLFSIVNGLTLSVIFLAYTAASITSVFFITAFIFGIMAFIGAVTKKDLTSLGTFLFVGLLGILAASVFNIFMGSEMVDFAVCVIGVIIFVGYTAYDVQKIKQLARANTGLSTDVLGLFGAITLYLDFINLFLKLLRLLGKRN